MHLKELWERIKNCIYIIANFGKNNLYMNLYSQPGTIFVSLLVLPSTVVRW